MTKKREARMKGISEGLTAQERGLLVLRAWKEGKDEYWTWRSTMPAWQARDFNRLIGLMNGVNQTLGVYLYAISQEVEKLTLRLGWLITLRLWSMRTSELPTYTDLGPRETMDSSEKVQEQIIPINELIDLHKEYLREGIDQRWQQLGAVQVVIGEIAREFDGEDPAVSRMRRSLDHTREELQGIFEQVTHLGLLQDIELSEPREEALAEVRELVER